MRRMVKMGEDGCPKKLGVSRYEHGHEHEHLRFLLPEYLLRTDFGVLCVGMGRFFFISMALRSIWALRAGGWDFRAWVILGLLLYVSSIGSILSLRTHLQHASLLSPC